METRTAYGCIGALALLQLTWADKASAVDFFDGTFNDNHWATTQLLLGTHDAFQVAADGNPGEFRRTDHANLDTGESIIVYHLLNTAVYDPGSSGGVATIDFSLDVRFLGGSEQTSQVGYRLVIEQGDAVYFADPVLAVAEGPGNGEPQPSWSSFGYGNIVESDFLLLDGSGTLDFSSAGEAMTFGYLTLNTVTLDNTSTSSGIDNWLVTVNPIPEPDTDSDGVPDNADNCVLAANGPLLPDAGGNAQRDTDGDGFGNVCDADLNNDCQTNAVDLGLFKAVFFTNDADADFDGDGIVNVVDLGLLKSLFFQPPGPGTGTCP